MPSPAANPHHPWWQSAVIYQIYPRSFADSNGDGIGDLQGIINHLDHLSRLGVDALWLSPIFPSPQVDAGYDISDYRDIDPLFGDLATFDRLVAEAHARGLRVILDMVTNHTSDRHPWFQASRASTTNNFRDWYHWRPPRPGFTPGQPGAEPNNWTSFFSGPAWTLDPATGQYYLHLFASAQPDLNWENPAVRQAIADMMRFWLDRGVDGFRMDVINLISKVPGLPDAAGAPGDLGDGSPYYTNGPRVHEFLAELRRAVLGEHDTEHVIIGETPGVTLEHARWFTDPTRGEVDMVFQFEHVGLDHDADKFRTHPLAPGALADCFARWADGLDEVGWNALYLSNHDQPRPASRFGDASPASAKALAAFLHLQRGTPFVYQGEELGMTNTHLTARSDLRDVESLNYLDQAMARGDDPARVWAGIAAMSRDNARTPMQWDASPHAGFTTGEPWIPVNPNHVERNAAAEDEDADSVLAWYHRLITLRHTQPIVAYGSQTRLDTPDPRLAAWRRQRDGEYLDVLINLSPDAVPVDGALAGHFALGGNVQPWAVHLAWSTQPA